MNYQTQRPDYQQELMQIIDSGISPSALKARILSYHESDIAAALESLEPSVRARLSPLLNAETLDSRQKLALILKETRASFVNGIILGAVSFVAVVAYYGSSWIFLIRILHLAG